ncbi:hypothetical protein DTO96_100589 [Ephemeroptericola cinctiostellae]|uniref:Metallo-beta-lactamase domain-containing protein n=1 Tax=Ephemeroptericola cinctiostellae TaxID=2268024 RepID=A0A345D940_9BURK|nr:MBL fold metallo-hydrolase [Ephemeroptericola cinctiostellae]AXF84878.1 hypothetical protein DTO96_100589 [Ephemeroptericola cinctiostellae]
MHTLFLLATLIGMACLARTLWFEFGRKPSPTHMQARAHSGQFQVGVFQNEIDTPAQTGDFSYSKLIRELIHPSNTHRKPPAAIPSEKINLHSLLQQAPSIVWFGHSSYLLTLNGFTILVDPVMAGHSAPLPFLINSFTGTDIYSVDDLPPIDLLLITHDHYDHLDYDTVKKLKPKVKQVITPLGCGEHLRFWGYDADIITELNWHESLVIGDHTITATPARHFSGRAFGRNTTLWASYVLKSTTHKLYLGGDSGYGPHFKAIGEQYGPFDLALLESGQYNPAWAFIHMMPEETVQAAQDLNARVLMPVHWGKFVLSLHNWDEPIQRLTAAAQQHHQTLFTPTLGKAMPLNGDYVNNPWWESIQ